MNIPPKQYLQERIPTKIYKKFQKSLDIFFESSKFTIISNKVTVDNVNIDLLDTILIITVDNINFQFKQ